MRLFSPTYKISFSSSFEIIIMSPQANPPFTPGIDVDFHTRAVFLDPRTHRLPPPAL
jgi:hypothetical protein